MPDDTVRPADAEMMAAAEAAYPREWVGALLGRDGEIMEVITLSNCSKLPEVSFTVEAKDLLSGYQHIGMELIGFAHSHPDAEPEMSTEDLDYAIHGLLYIVVPVIAGRAQRPVYHQL